MAAHDVGSLLGGLLSHQEGGGPAGSSLGDLLSAVGRAQSDGAANPLCGLLDVLVRSGTAMPPVPDGSPSPPDLDPDPSVPEPSLSPSPSPPPSANGIARLSERAHSALRTAAD
jgi:hypothetical protein